MKKNYFFIFLDNQKNIFTFARLLLVGGKKNSKGADIMEKFLNTFENLNYFSYRVQIEATAEVAFDAWAGAIIRNNLLYFAENIRLQKTNRSLREQIDTFPLNDSHPLYKELKDGFPKGYVLTDFSHADMAKPYFSFQKGESFSFSLLLIGRFNEYRYFFFEAIREMCERGIGKPITPFHLIDIKESLSSPVSLSDFLPSESTEIPEIPSTISIHFQTPMILYRLREKKNPQLSYQDKCNRFPSLYQLTRSALTRLQKLHALYAESDVISKKKVSTDQSLFEETSLEAFLEKAGHPLLKSTNLQHIHLPNTQKKEKSNDIPLVGYIGEQKYEGHFQQYLPLLKFMAGLGVGNETVYGMGRYEIEEATNKSNKV